jgi:16S rRNA (guanine527-N7)-methyltransferase
MTDPVLPGAVIEEAVRKAGLVPLPLGVPNQFSRFADLLLKWNSKLNLTAIRTPDEILRRHFLEGIFCAQCLPAETGTLLDFGSGAGFPGIPIALSRPGIRVTLAESQSKKAAFLREAVRALALNAEVFDRRVGDMALESTFDVVTMRAVDKMETAVQEAARRIQTGGALVLLTTAASLPEVSGFQLQQSDSIPNSSSGIVATFSRYP